MARPQTDKFEETYFGRSYKKPIENRLNSEQVTALEKEMRPFYVTKLVTWPPYSTPEKCSVFDERAFLEHKGAMRYGRIVISGYKPPKYGSEGRVIEPRDCEPILYEQLCEDIKQVQKAKSKGVFA